MAGSSRRGRRRASGRWEEAIQLILKMWTEPRTTFHGRYFHIEDAILEPKPVQQPHPPVMIAGGGEQMTLRVVAHFADASNLVCGDVADARNKLAVLHGHCDTYADRDGPDLHSPGCRR
jgi:alkanesulfonate monooxygenase SsuD/methylene tetrahydromethanopterin reductase-like flavin-dependent oxidoreductase (luciferase family)